MGMVAEALIELGIEVIGAQEAEKAVGGVNKSTKTLKKEGGQSIDGFVKDGDKSLKGLVKSFGGAKGAMLLGVAAIGAAVLAAASKLNDFVTGVTAGLDKISKDATAAGLTAESSSGGV